MKGKPDLPRGFWCVEDHPEWMRIGFLFGGHMGGECEIRLPKSLLPRFCDDADFRSRTTNRYFKVTLLGDSNAPMSLPASEVVKTGIVSDDWV